MTDALAKPFPPLGCRVCGFSRYGHMTLSGRDYGWHTWQPPTRQQIRSAILAQRFVVQHSGPKRRLP